MNARRPKIVCVSHALTTQGYRNTITDVSSNIGIQRIDATQILLKLFEVYAGII